MTGRPVIVAALVSLAVSVSMGATPAFKKAQRLAQRGEQALRSGELERADESFRKALETEPGFPTAHIGLGHVAMGRGEFDAALVSYEAAIDEYSRFSDQIERVQAQRYRSARDQISDLRDTISQLRSSASNQRFANMEISKLELAISRLEIVEPPDPDALAVPPTEYRFYVGNARFQLGDVDGAIAAWERCRDAKPKFAMVYNNLALAYWKRGRLDEALAALELAGELGFPVDPNFERDLRAAAAKAG